MSKNALNHLTILLVLIASVKMIGTVFSDPIVGYANNFDFRRQSSCVGLWQDYPGRPNSAANPKQVLNALIYDGHTDPTSCIRSTDNLFPYLATLFHQLGDRVDFRAVSLWKAVFIVALTTLLLSQIDVPSIRAALGFAFLLVFGDFANLSYFNTLYLEFSVLAGGFLSLCAGVWLSSSLSRPSPLMIALSVGSVVWLGLAKQQYMPLAVTLSLLFALIVFVRWRGWGSAALFFVVAGALPIAFGALNRSDHGLMRSMSYANRTNTFLLAVLPAATDQDAALRRLGLPSSCRQGIGKSWYMPEVRQSHPCPEVEDLSRLRLAGLFLHDPRTFFVPMLEATSATRPLRPSHLAMYEDPEDILAVKYRILDWSSLTTLLSALPAGIFSTLGLASMISGVLLGIRLLWQLFSRPSHSPVGSGALAMLALGGGTVFYSIASSVFGDGYIGVPKHAICFSVGIAFQLAGLATLISSRLCRWIRGDLFDPTGDVR